MEGEVWREEQEERSGCGDAEWGSRPQSLCQPPGSCMWMRERKYEERRGLGGRDVENQSKRE